MPKAHKPPKSSNINLRYVYGKRAISKKNVEFWENWDPARVESYLEVPHRVGKFSKNDPRIVEWRRLTRRE